MSALLCTWLLCSAIQVSAPPTGEEADATPPIRGADLALLAEVRSIARAVAELRGQSFARPPVAVRAPDEMRRVAADIRALNVLQRDRLQARGRAWSDLGLGGAESPTVLYRALAADLKGIGFDPEGNRLLVAPDRLTERDFTPEAGEAGPATVLLMTGVRVDEPLVGHMLMHVRQRERRGGDSLAETTDGLLAGSAWAEGEANLVAVRYLFAGMGLADAVLEQPIDPGTVLDGRLVPAELSALQQAETSLMRFVYEHGFAAAARAFRDGGWPALDAAMTRRLTTRDLLHLEREPLGVAEFSTPAPPAPELQLADQDSLGEQGIFVLVSSTTSKDSLALQAADGWIGDRLYRWETVTDGALTGTGVTVWVSRWADESEADEFHYALLRTLAARFPGRPPVRLADGQHVLQTSERLIRLQRTGGQVHLQIAARELDRLPEGAHAGS